MNDKVPLDLHEVAEFVEKANKNLDEKNEETQLALSYLINTRGFNNQSIRQNNIGYCDTKSQLPKCLYDAHYEKFILGRIIVPIYSEFGELVSFATRSANSSIKGWWHIPFKKRSHLFLLDKSRKYIFESEKAYIMEGFIDALIAFQQGIKNVVSTMGTSLQYRRVGLLYRYCDRFCLCFDVDENNAGQDAQLKAIGELNRYGVENISQIKLPVNTDPDDFILKNGIDEFYKLEQNITEEDQILAQKKLNEKYS